MNRAQRNHNPGNLRFAGQREAIGRDEAGMAVFPHDPAGWRALVAQIRLDQRRGLTVSEFVRKYAPPSENDTEAYLRFVAGELRCHEPVAVRLSDYSPYAIAGIMARYEGYFNKE